MGLNPKIVIPVLIGVSLCGVSAAVLYLLFKKEDEEKFGNGVVSTKSKLLEIPIPSELVPVIIGRGGSNIRDLEAQTGARITMREVPLVMGSERAERICMVRGSSEAIACAEAFIRNIVAGHSDLQQTDIKIPSWSAGKVIGRGGENIRDICHTTGAKVTVESLPVGNDSAAAQRKVSIKGSPDQIKMATDMIERHVSAEKKRREADTSRREPRGRHAASAGAVEAAGADSNGALLEVFVSAVSSPSRFWLQIVGPQVEQLDKLVETMTEYYSNVDNRDLHKLKDVQVGQIVAAVFRHDGKWYRAKVSEIKQNEFDGRQQVCDVHFVDYGDNEYVATNELFALQSDMLRLRFQAVECFLAGVVPNNLEQPEGSLVRWKPKAIERFEELTQVALWKRLWSRTCAFKDRPPPVAEGGDNAARNVREGSPIPGVKLYDTKDGKDIDIAEVMLEEGWAVPLEEAAPAPLSPTSSSTTLPTVPPSFGDLECSRVLGMVMGDREERAASLPHRPSPQASPKPNVPKQGDAFNILSDDSKPKSMSLAAGMDHGDFSKYSDTSNPGSVSELSYSKPEFNGSDTPHLNGSTTNGNLKSNGAFLNAERGSSATDSFSSPSKEVPKPHPFHIPDPKDELKAKMNRVDSHHGNLEDLNKHAPPPGITSQSKFHDGRPIDKSF